MGSSAKDACPTSETLRQRRIYVGGIDPVRGLTSKDVLRRLESRLDQASIQTQDLHVGDRYFQFTAVCKDNDEDPLATIKSWFHNVTWKGCKLRVEEARPHFLQRLQSEIKARRKSVEQEILAVDTTGTAASDGKAVVDTNDLNMPSPSSTSGVSSLPRHWRVRRGFGFTAHNVDTQPCKVTSWEKFSRIRERHKMQQEKLTAEALSKTSNVDQKKLSYYNRSIHLSFFEYGADSAAGAANLGSNGDPDGASASSFEDSSSSDSSDSTTDNGELRNGSKYVWSNDDSDSTSDDSSTEKRKERPHAMAVEGTGSFSEESSEDDDNQRHRNQSLHEEEESSVAYESEESKEGFDESKLKVHGKSTTTPEKVIDPEYVWSDDDSSSDGSRSSEKRQKSTMFRQVKPRDDDLDEFAPGVVDFDTGSVSTSSERNSTCDDDKGPAALECHEANLQRDVETNLQVLSQLFPEFSKQEPLQTDADIAKNEEMAAVNKPTTTSGWGVAGQMLRFDPTNPQFSNRFVLEENNNSSSSSSVDEDEEIPMQDTPQSPKADTKANTNIYEQGKLEQVFKEMRESADQVVPAASGAGGSGFSFGFDLGDAKRTDPKPSGSFSFSFSVPAIHDEATPEEMDKLEDVDKNPSEADALSEHPIQFQRRRRRAFEFPSEEELEERVRHFYYDLNDGRRVIEDLDGWRNDPAVKERWMKERFTLTQDWKRKRKYALSKKQKRLK